MNVQFTIDNREFQRAAAMYAERKGKSDADVVNKAMRYLLPFAASRVRKKTRGANKIAGELRANLGGSSQMSRAAAIIRARLKEKGLLGKKQKVPFKTQVEKLIEARMRSANFLRAGFIPMYRQFQVPGGTVPGIWRHKGFSRGIKAVPSLTRVSEAFVTNQREGAYKIAPNAFSDALPEVTRQFLKWLEQDTIEQGRRSGFT